MESFPNSAASFPSGKSGMVGNSEADPPPSVPLQIFLFCAFVITLAAYIAGERSKASGTDDAGRWKNEQLHRLFQEKTKSANFTKIGFQEENQKHYALAISNFQNAIIVQNTPEAHLNLGNALVLASRFPEGLEQFKAAIALDPKMRDAYTSWGQVLLNQGNAEAAAQVYVQASAKNPDYSLFHFKRGLALAALKKYPDALDAFSQAAKMGLDDSDFWLQFGTVENHEDRFAEAETNLARAAALRADLPGAQFQLAVAQQHLGEWTNAIAHYETALTQSPGQADTLNNLALIYATAPAPDVRNPKMAVELATQASNAAADKNPRFMDTLARACAADGDFLQATLWEKKALDQAGQSGDKDLQSEMSARYALFQQHKLE